MNDINYYANHFLKILLINVGECIIIDSPRTFAARQRPLIETTPGKGIVKLIKTPNEL